MFKLVLLLLLGLSACALRFTGNENQEEVRELLDGVAMVSLQANTQEDVEQLTLLVANEDGVGELSQIHRGTVEMLVRTDKLPLFESFDKFHVSVPNMGELIDARRGKNVDQDDWFEEYHTLTYIHDKIDEMVARYPNIATRVTIGLSWEGRPIHGIRISGPNPTKAIVYHGGIHAREWIGPAVVQWIYKELLEGYGLIPLITQLVNEIEWTIIPVLNVDGYTYAFDVNPAWRKTRKPNIDVGVPECVGTDPNRNWEFMWASGGSSEDPCSNAYRGGAPFDNPEPRSVSQYIAERQAEGLNVLGYIDWHCCGLLLMSPWAYISPAQGVPADDVAQLALLNQWNDASRAVNGINFRVGNIGNPAIIGIASGSSVDHVYQMGVTYSYGVELRADSQFDPSVIIPSGQECFAGVLVMGQQILIS